MNLPVLKIVVIGLSSLALPASLFVGYTFGTKTLKKYRWLVTLAYVLYDALYSLLYWTLMGR